ncbi:MAG: APC family permease, partial [Steroidobacteraceae bacterium]
MTSLASRLRLPEAVGLSLSVVAPTVTAAFNITLVVQATGAAAPLALAIGMVAIALVALSFMAFTHRVAHAGSAYAYIAHTFGSRAGFIAGWTLLLTYLGFATGFAALVGSFTGAALKEIGIEVGSWWIGIGLVSLLLAWWLAYRDMRLAGRLMLLLEAIAIAAILVLCIEILRQVHPTPAEVRSTFEPSANFNGWSGLGFGMVFSVLSFAGFEGAATLGEETINPRRNIPIALLGTVIFTGIFFVFVAYCEVIGYGTQGLKALANSQAPLDDLARRYASPRLAIFLDLAAATSCFSGALGGLAAAARIVFALGRAGLAPARA